MSLKNIFHYRKQTWLDLYIIKYFSWFYQTSEKKWKISLKNLWFSENPSYTTIMHSVYNSKTLRADKSISYLSRYYIPTNPMLPRLFSPLVHVNDLRLMLHLAVFVASTVCGSAESLEGFLVSGLAAAWGICHHSSTEIARSFRVVASIY